MEPGGSGVAGLGDTAGHWTCTKGRQASSQRPHLEISAGRGLFLGSGGNFLSGPFPSGVKGWNTRELETGRGVRPLRGEEVVGAALAAGWGLKGGGAQEAEALTHEPGQRGELLQGVKGPAGRPQLTEVPRREESAQQHPCARTAPRTPSAWVKRELG